VPETKNKPPPRGEVLKLRPALLRDRDAAEYLARSASWIRQKRAYDVKATREARATSARSHITIGASVFYRLQDLDEWIATNAVPRGVVTFSNRAAARWRLQKPHRCGRRYAAWEAWARGDEPRSPAGSPSANYFGVADVSAGAAFFLAFLAFLLAFLCALRSLAASFLAGSVEVGICSSAAMALKAMKTTAARAAAIVRTIVKLLGRAPGGSRSQFGRTIEDRGRSVRKLERLDVFALRLTFVWNVHAWTNSTMGFTHRPWQLH
jgi:hypothetical protein